MIYVGTGLIALIIAAIWFLAYRMRRAGEDSMAAKVTEKTAEAFQKMDKAGADSPKTKDGLVDLLRKGGL